MHTSSSANRTCNEFSSASEYTATVLMLSSRHAWMMRSAISPRLAIRIFLNMWFDGEEPLAVVDGLAVFHVDLDDLAVDIGVDLVHQLHRFDDAEDLPLLHDLSDVRKGLRSRFRLAIERADNRRLHNGKVDILIGRRQDWGWRSAVVAHTRRGSRRRDEGALRKRRYGAVPLLAHVLAQPQLHSVAFELELGQVVLAHHFQDLLDLV